MKTNLLVIFLLVHASGMASAKTLVLDDIGSEKAAFNWVEIGKDKIALSASVEREMADCDDAEVCHANYASAAIEGFRREGRDIYYVGTDGIRVRCGRAPGFLSASQFTDSCQISVESAPECVAWIGADDCIHAVTRYRVYLAIENRNRMSAQAY